MKIAVMICRILLGAGFIVFGANILHSFLPMPPIDPASPHGIFFNLMMPSGYMAVVGLFQLVGGILVLIGGTAPLGLALLAPVLVNILAFHVCLDKGEGIAPGLVFSVLEAFLVYSYWGYFKPIFTTKAKA
jgi:putative oxidoreductase